MVKGSEVKSPSSISSVNRELKRKFQTNLTSRKYKCKANFTENFAPVNGFKKKITLNGQPLNACFNYYT